jgi:hypothetical protein
MNASHALAPAAKDADASRPTTGTIKWLKEESAVNQE